MGNEKQHQKSLVTYHTEDHVGFITLNRPEKRNALNLALWKDLDKAIAQAEEDQKIRVVLLHGEGKSFCAGLDLGPENEIISALSGTPNASQKENFFKLVRQIQGTHNRLERLPVPTVALIHGHCLGAGLELVLCCDIRICSADAIFALPEARLAIITDVGGLQRLPRVVGPGHAREIAFRGHALDAEKARRINLVNEVYPDKKSLLTEAMKMATEIAGNPPLAVQGAKDVLLFTEDATLSQSLDYNAARSSMIMPSQDLFEAISAHVQKRKGEFKGA
jgi:enoyl-CoA hydratase